MKRLFVLRHAKALREAKPRLDHARPLAPLGVWAAETMADHCARRLRRVDFVLCSSAIRARETLRLFERHLPPSRKVMIEDDLYLAEPGALRKALRAVDDRFDSVLLVGHEPGLSDLIERVCGEAGNSKARKRLAKGFKTASLASIDLSIERWRDLAWKTGRLHSVVRPRDLR